MVDGKRICINCINYKPNQLDDSHGRCLLHQKIIMVTRWDAHCVNWSRNRDANIKFDPNEQDISERMGELQGERAEKERRKGAIFPDLFKRNRR